MSALLFSFSRQVIRRSIEEVFRCCSLVLRGLIYRSVSELARRAVVFSTLLPLMVLFLGCRLTEMLADRSICTRALAVLPLSRSRGPSAGFRGFFVPASASGGSAPRPRSIRGSHFLEHQHEAPAAATPAQAILFLDKDIANWQPFPHSPLSYLRLPNALR